MEFDDGAFKIPWNCLKFRFGQFHGTFQRPWNSMELPLGHKNVFLKY